MAVKIDITRYRGDTDPLVFTFKKDGSPIDITGSTFTLSVSVDAAPTSPVYILQMSGVITNAIGGVVTFTPTEQEADFIGSYFFDIEKVGSDKKTVVVGKYKMVQDITK